MNLRLAANYLIYFCLTAASMLLGSVRAENIDLLMAPQSGFDLTPINRVDKDQDGGVAAASNEMDLAVLTLDEQLIVDHPELQLGRPDSAPVSKQEYREKTKESGVNAMTGTLSVKAAVFGLPKEYFSSFVSDSEIVGMKLIGSRSSTHRAGVGDLDVALSNDQQRFLPLVRLLKGFSTGAARVGTRIEFQPEYSAPVAFDVSSGLLSIGGQAKVIPFISGISDVTQAREIYVPVEVIADIFGFQMEWDDEQYEYIAKTDQVLSMWKKKSMLGDVQMVPTDLPQAHPPASPSTPLLSFIETRTNIGIDSGVNGENPRATLSMNQSLYGHLFGGRYKLSFSQPSLTFNEDNGLNSSDSNITLPQRIEWTKEIGERSQLYMGDTSFNLNDLAMPFIGNMSGVRVSGILGAEAEDSSKGIPQFSLSNSFLQTKDYSGLARLGSDVKLIVNENVVATADVIEEAGTPNGYGRYEFFDVSLPGGSLVDIRIEIREPDGNLITLDKSSVRADRLLPEGQIAYLGGMGTRRDLNEWGSQGLLGGARVLYGVSPTLTLGVTAAYQDSYYSTNSSDTGFRGVAESSAHLATEFAWLAHNKLLISGDLAFSAGDSSSDGVSYDGSAVRLRSDWYPITGLDFSTQLFRYEPGFFNGQNDQLEDRQGFNIASRWKYKNWFNLKGSLGNVENNLKGDKDISREASYQSLELYTNRIPNASLRVKADRITPDEGTAQSSYTFGAGYGLYGFSINGEISEASNRLDAEYLELLRGIGATGVQLYPNRSKTLRVNKRLFGRHSMGFSWTDNEFSPGYTISHRWSGNSLFGRSRLLPIGEELHHYDLFNEFRSDDRQETVTSRLNIYLDKRRQNRLGLVSRYGTEQGWSLSADLNLTSLFWAEDGLENISNSGIYPGSTGVKGKVFLDANANKILDPGEEGIAGIKVNSRGRPGVVTDDKGNFIFAAEYGADESNVYLDGDSIPALLSPTHAMQTAYLGTGAYTEINFGLAPVISLNGLLLGQEQNKKSHRPIKGAKILLFDDTGELITESITASDGSYFIDTIPGRYKLKVDTSTVSGRFVLAQSAQDLNVTGSEEYQEMAVSPLYAKLLSPTQLAKLGSETESAPDWTLDIPLLEESMELLESWKVLNIGSELELISDELGFDI